jgi:uracil-DNA glycosylase
MQDQVDSIQPKVLLLLGPSALSFIQIPPNRFEELRGQPLEGPAPLVLATYDPIWVKMHPQLKRPVWEDLKLLKDFVEHGR